MPDKKNLFVSRSSKRKTETVSADNELDARNGSRRRILEFTSAPSAVVADTLSALIEGYGAVSPSAIWTPHGKNAPAPARLDETPGLVKNPAHKAALHDWWVSDEPLFNRALTQRQTAGRASRAVRLPPFDFASTFTPPESAPERNGVLIVHAAAHIGELNSDHSHQREKTALPQIHKAFAEATEGWNALLKERAETLGYKLSHRVKLSTDSHYRLSCNFAVAWKLARLGVPTILLYLGFLDATELEPDGYLAFRDHEMWEKCVFEKTSKPLPEEIWDTSFTLPSAAPLAILRRSLRMDLPE